MALPKDRTHIALNLRVQAEANDLLQQRAAAVAAELGEDALYLQVHDELVVEVPVEQVKAAGDVLQRLMLTPFMGVEMRGEVKMHGERWGK
jgi:DNA polymerase I-like protein with 3'-5' exonuclease and polymerase domains